MLLVQVVLSRVVTLLCAKNRRRCVIMKIFAHPLISPLMVSFLISPQLPLVLTAQSLPVGDGSDRLLSLNQKMVSEKDNAEMVLVPAGEFEMGTDVAEIPQLVEWAERYNLNAHASWYADESPRHRVSLDAFYIDRYEVTNAQYRMFIEGTGYREPTYWDDAKYNQPNQPVVAGRLHLIFCQLRISLWRGFANLRFAAFC